MYDYQLDPAFIKNKLIDLKDRLRWNSLRIDGIKERPRETCDDCEKQLDTHFKERLGIQKEVVNERAHRVKKKKKKKVNATKSVVCRILSHKDKVKILRNAKKLKGENIFIKKDFCQAALDHFKDP